MTPFFYHGHLTHPDIWTMWFSLAVSSVVVIRWILEIVGWLWRAHVRSFLRLTERLEADRLVK